LSMCGFNQHNRGCLKPHLLINLKVEIKQSVKLTSFSIFNIIFTLIKTDVTNIINETI